MTTAKEESLPAVAWPVLLGLAAIKLVLGLIVGSGYGFFRDEFYYLACGQRPDWGYVDQPPLVPLIGRLAEATFGATNLTAGELRITGVLASAATVVLAGLMARELGGRRFAQGLAAFTVLVMPLYVAAGVSFGTVVFDQLLWTLVLWLVLRALRTGTGRGWLWVGLCAGIGLETKHTMGMLGLGLTVAFVLTPEGRRLLRAPWPWLGGALAVACLLPNLLWQHAHGWPTLEFIHNSNANHRMDWTLAGFLKEQVLFVGAWQVPLLALGVWRTFSAADKPGARWMVTVFAVALGILLVTRGKAYYLGAIYPSLAAVSGMEAEEWSAPWAERRAWIRPAWIVGAVLCLLPILPVVLPILPKEKLAGSWEVRINHDFAEEFGWRELASQVVGIFRGLPDTERTNAVVLTVNYGEAASIQRLDGMTPAEMPVVCPHNNYWLWGPGTRDPQTVIVVGARHRAWMEELFDRVDLAATIDNPLHIANEERGKGIYLCRAPKKSLRAAWPDLKGFD